LQDVLGDGNCGPRAVSVLIYDNEEGHNYIRQQAIKYLKNINNWELNTELTIELSKRFWIDNQDNTDTFTSKILSYADAMNKNKSHIDSDVTTISIAYALNKRIRVWMLTHSKNKGIHLHPVIDWNSYNIPEPQALNIVYFPKHYQALVKNSDRRSKQLAQFRINTSEVTATMELKELYKSPAKPALLTASTLGHQISDNTKNKNNNNNNNSNNNDLSFNNYNSTISESITPIIIANHDRLLSKIPHPCYHLWIQNCRKLFTDYIKASVDNNLQSKLDIIIQLLYLPQRVLKSNSLRFSTKRQCIKSFNKLNDRLEYTLRLQNNILDNNTNTSHVHVDADTEIDIESDANNDHNDNNNNNNNNNYYYQDDRTQTSTAQSVLKPLTETQTLYMNNNINHTKYYLANGYIGKAAKALVQQTSVVNLNDEQRLQQLLDVHPTPKGPDYVDYHTNLPRCPSDSPSIIIDADESFIKCITELANGSAPGPSGWTGEMGKVLARDDTCLKGLATLVNDIVNGNLPDKAKDYILASRLIALDKNQGNSLRPIAIGEYFYRLAASRQIKQVANQIPKLLLPLQYGVGISGGCEHVIHTVQHALENTHTPLAALAIDFKNAFNAISRRAVLRSLYNHPELESLYKLVDFAYSKPSTLFINVGDNNYQPLIQSSQGVNVENLSHM